PGSGHAGNSGLTAKLAFGADLTRHAADLAGEGVELVHHGVDGILQLEDFAFHLHGDLATEVPARDSGGDIGDVAHLRGQVVGHRIDVVGEILPGASDTFHQG